MVWPGASSHDMTSLHCFFSCSNTNHQTAASVLNDRFLGNLGSVEQVEDHSFNSHELAVLSASLDPCVPEAAGRLPSIFKVHELHLTRGISESLVDEAVDTFWEFFQEGNVNGMTHKRLRAQHARLTQKMILVDQGVDERRVPSAARYRRNPFIEWSMDLADTARRVEEIGEQFGRWQDLEFRGLSNFLGRMECLRSTDFYKATLNVPRPFEFDESAVVVFAVGTFGRVCLAATWPLLAALLGCEHHLLTTTSFCSLCCIDQSVAASNGAHDQRLQHRLLNWLRTYPQRGSRHH